MNEYRTEVFIFQYLFLLINIRLEIMVKTWIIPYDLFALSEVCL